MDIPCGASYLRGMENTNDAGAALTQLQDHVSVTADLFETRQAERCDARCGDPVKLLAMDRGLLETGRALAGLFLTLSKARRDAGDHNGAIRAARNFATMEGDAQRLQSRLERISG